MASKLTQRDVREKPVWSRFVLFLLCVAIVVLAVFIAVTIIKDQMQINEYSAQYDELAAQTNATLEENAKISRYLENDKNLEEYIEAIARNKLGYAKPDERIFYIIPASGD